MHAGSLNLSVGAVFRYPSNFSFPSEWFGPPNNLSSRA
jgi:hypothetical protein